MNGQNGSIMQFPRDTVILREGETTPEMYQIIKGHAELYTGYGTKEEVLLGIIGQQACFGEFGLLLGKPSVYTVIAYSDLVVLRIGEGSLGTFIRDNQRKVAEIMRNMANTMLVMQQHISLLSTELEKAQKEHGTDPETTKIIHRARRNLRGYAIYNAPLENFEDYMSVFNTRG